MEGNVSCLSVDVMFEMGCDLKFNNFINRLDLWSGLNCVHVAQTLVSPNNTYPRRAMHLSHQEFDTVPVLVTFLLCRAISGLPSLFSF